MELMGKEAVSKALQQLTGWNHSENSITKTYELSNFRSAVGFVNRVADTAEQQQHHPDISIHGSSLVTVTLSTRSAGGVTSSDITMATHVESLAQQS